MADLVALKGQVLKEQENNKIHCRVIADPDFVFIESHQCSVIVHADIDKIYKINQLLNCG